MTAVIESVDFVRKMLNTYASDFKGIYFAIIITLAVAAICNLKNKAIRSYIIYTLVILISLLVIGFLDYAFGFLPSKKEGEINNVFPAITVILLGFAILLPFLVRKSSNNKKKRIWCMGIVIASVIVFLVEASVPLKWTLKNFTTSRELSPYTSDVKEIADTIGTYLVLLPEDYKVRVKDCNKNANILDGGSSYYDYESPSHVFIFAAVNGVDYIVIKEKDYFGNTNAETLNVNAATYNYKFVKDLGDYIIYGSPNVV